MSILPLLIYDLATFFVILLLTISSLYSAWVNLAQKRISKVGFDAFVLLFFNKRKATMIRKDSRLIRRMGILTLLIAIGGMNEVISIFVQDI